MFKENEKEESDKELTNAISEINEKNKAQEDSERNQQYNVEHISTESIDRSISKCDKNRIEQV